MPRVLTAILMLALVTLPTSSAAGETLVIADSTRVADAPLLDVEFAGWNFGGGPLLEAGYMVGIYTEHRAASVIRFDLSHTKAEAISGATLRLYKPLSFVQLRDVEVALHEVDSAHAGWGEGTAIAEAAEGVTWDSIRPPKSAPFATQVAPMNAGDWIEFKIPVEIVRRWIDDPDSNAGVYVTVPAAEKWGDHVYFHASEHFYGKGPQLVIEVAKVNYVAAHPRKATLYNLPPAGAFGNVSYTPFAQWVNSRKRLAGFARHGRMTPQQARLFYLFDTHIRHELILKRYQIPVLDAFNRIEQALAEDDAAAARRELDEVRRRMLVWEYIRETSWYTSGPLADVLTPRQLGILFGRSIFGRMEERAGEEDRGIWQVVPPEQFDEHVERTLRDMARRLELSPEQIAALRPHIAEYERLENNHLVRFRENLARVQAMIEQVDVDDAAMMDEVRQLHLNHEAFLYYQSIYNTPRWELWKQHVDPRPLARWIVDVRRRHYESAVRAVTEE